MIEAPCLPSDQLSRPIYRDGSSRRCSSVRESSCSRLRIFPVHQAKQVADIRFLNSFSDSSKSSGDPDMAALFGGARICDGHETSVDNRPT